MRSVGPWRKLFIPFPCFASSLRLPRSLVRPLYRKRCNKSRPIASLLRGADFSNSAHDGAICDQCPLRWIVQMEADVKVPLSFRPNLVTIILMNSIRRGMHSLRREINLNNGNAVTGCTVLEIRWATASNHVKSSRNLVLFSGNKHIRHSAFLAFPPPESSKSACLLQRWQNHLARAE